MGDEETLFEKSVRLALEKKEHLDGQGKLAANLIRKIYNRSYQVKHIGLENLLGSISPDMNLIFSVNHGFEYDPFMSFIPICFGKDKFISTLSKEETWYENMFKRFAVVSSTAIPVGRGNGDREFINTLTGLIDSNVWLGIAPEGTRTYGGGPVKFGSGLGHTYKFSQADAIVPTYVSREHVPKVGKKVAYVNYGLPVSPDKRRAKDVVRELEYVQDRLAVVMSDHIFSRIIYENAKKGSYDVYSFALVDDALHLFEEYLSQGCFVDTRLIEGDELDIAVLFDHANKYLGFMEQADMMHEGKVDPSKVLLTFDRYMRDEFHEAWSGDYNLMTPDEQKEYAKGYVKANPIGYLKNGIMHLGLPKDA